MLFRSYRRLVGTNSIMDGHFSQYFIAKSYIVCLNRPKIREKEAWDVPFKTI